MAGTWTFVFACVESLSSIVGGFAQFAPNAWYCALFGAALGFVVDVKRPTIFKLPVGMLLTVMLVGIVLYLCCSGYPDGFAPLISSVFAREKPGFIYLPTYLSEFLRPEIAATAFFAFISCALCLFMVDAVRSLRHVQAARASMLVGLAIGWCLVCLSMAGGVPTLYLFALSLVMLFISGNLSKVALLVTGACLVGVLVSVAFSQPSHIGLGKEKLFSVTPEVRWSQGSRYSAHLVSSRSEPLAVLVLKDNLFYTIAVDPLMNPGSVRYFRKYVLNLDPSFFTLSFQLGLEPKKALVLRSGTGNMVSACLLAGATKVVAVDDRPWLADMANWSFNSPYRVPVVEKKDSDPRSFLAKNKEKFDLIVFSERRASRESDLLYTQESFVMARERLAADGKILVVAIDPEVMCQVYRQSTDSGLFKTSMGPFGTKYGSFVVLVPNYDVSIPLPKDEAQSDADFSSDTGLGSSTDENEPGKIETVPICRRRMPLARNLSNNFPIGLSSARQTKLESYLYTIMITVTLMIAFGLVDTKRIKSIDRNHLIAFILGYVWLMNLFCTNANLRIMLGESAALDCAVSIAFWFLLPLVYFLRKYVSRVSPILLLVLSLFLLLLQSVGGVGVIYGVNTFAVVIGFLLIFLTMSVLSASIVHERLANASMTPVLLGLAVGTAVHRLPLQIGYKEVAFLSAAFVLVILVGFWYSNRKKPVVDS